MARKPLGFPMPRRGSGRAFPGRTFLKTLASLLAICLSPVSGAPESQEGSEVPQSRSRPIYPGAPVMVSVPLFDAPSGLRGGFDSPSMRQSLQWNAGAMQLGNQTIGWLWEGMRPSPWQSIGTWASLALFNYLAVYLPPGEAWMHEEWHRAVLTRRGVKSHNGVYHWDLGTEAISVDHVADADLAELKRDHPADFIRLMEAGLEGEVESIRLMRRTNFFLGRQSRYDALTWWTWGLNATAYLYLCSLDDLDPMLKDMERREPLESQRDFTGLDFRAWVHDLRNPGEPYAGGPRGGPHPAGPGVDRYLEYGDLTHGERVYLRAQAGLSLLNFVSPQYFGKDWLPGKNPWGGRGYLWNFGLFHHLTPFGFDVGGDFLVRRGKWAWVFNIQALVNGETALPGFGGDLFRYPLILGRTALFVSGGASAWLQPKDLLFRTASAQPGGSLRAGAALPLRTGLELIVEADAKSGGWEPGNVHLDAAVQGRTGLQLRL